MSDEIKLEILDDSLEEKAVKMAELSEQMKAPTAPEPPVEPVASFEPEHVVPTVEEAQNAAKTINEAKKEPQNEPAYATQDWARRQAAYHAPNGPQQPPPANGYYSALPPEPPQKTRRVGTFTMGLALIVTGIAAIIGMFYPSFNFVWLAKLSPIILVLLGIEVLLSHLFGKGAKIKYDFLSGFMCFILICASVGMLAFIPLAKQYSFRDNDNSRAAAEIDEQLYKILQGSPIASLGTEVYIQGLVTEPDAITAQSLRPQDFVRVTIMVLGDFKDELGFATECKKILDKLPPAYTNNNHVKLHSLNTDKNGDYYELNIDDKFERALPADKLALIVNNSGNEMERQYDELESRREEQQSQLEQQRSEAQSQAEQRRSEAESQYEEQQRQLESQREEQQKDLENQQQELERQREEQQKELERQREEQQRVLERQRSELGSSRAA